MKSSPIIHVEGISKCYRLGQRESYKAMRDVITNAVKMPFSRLKRRGKYKGASDSVFWALDDITFDVWQGEVLGIIGRNGAGKSTLLKILSRITRPTRGHAELFGRVGSLLEVGTGFHPELSGRENIYLNGAILGMKRSEIERKFAEIVAFSEIEKFLDTPVKRYSSGMYVRLAFSVAAHLDPEVLIVDEVLAVGDLAFQKKCLGKMGEVAQEGRTILFVSHNMSAIQRLCSRAILLSEGKVVMDGDVLPVTETYIAHGLETTESRSDLLKAELPASQRRQMGDLRFALCEIRNELGENCAQFRLGEPVTVFFEIHSEKDYDDLDLGFFVDSINETRITTVRSIDQEVSCAIQAGKPMKVSITLEDIVLTPGFYTLLIFVHSGRYAMDVVNRPVQFEITEIPYENQRPMNKVEGLVRIGSRWRFES